MLNLGDLVKELKIKYPRVEFDDAAVEAMKSYSEQPYRFPGLEISFSLRADDLEEWYERHHGS